MPLSEYIEMGNVHTSGDKVISEGQLTKLQKDLNAHVKMLYKIFNIGAGHGEKNTARIRSSLTSRTNFVAVLWLMPKDYKEKKVSMVSRPVVSIITSRNLHQHQQPAGQVLQAGYHHSESPGRQHGGEHKSKIL